MDVGCLSLATMRLKDARSRSRSIYAYAPAYPDGDFHAYGE